MGWLSGDASRFQRRSDGRRVATMTLGVASRCEGFPGAVHVERRLARSAITSTRQKNKGGVVVAAYRR
jgi:hypothetical protein